MVIKMEKPYLRPHEKTTVVDGAERTKVNPYIKQYAAQLAAGSVVSTLPDGRTIRLADPVEHGYIIEPRQPSAENLPGQMSLTDGVPIIHDDVPQNYDGPTAG